MLFHKTTFDFSSEAKAWAIAYYENLFKENFNHNLEGGQLNRQDAWRASPVGQELLNYLSQYNCDTSSLLISAHLCNSKESGYGKPHVDIINPNNKMTIVNTRFNVMILGNPSDPMVWWTDMPYNDSRMVESTQFNGRTGKPFKTITMPGETTKEKLNYLGKADVYEPNLLTPSAFVRTDIVHTIFHSAGPRLVITVGFDKSIDELIN